MSYDGIIGIDLGTTYSCVAIWEGAGVKVLLNDEGSNVTPSWVAFIPPDAHNAHSTPEIIVGDAAKRQAASNPNNTLYDVKRLIGKRYTDIEELGDLDHLTYNITHDRFDCPIITVLEKTFKPEQISAYVLMKMKSIAETYLQKRVHKAVITVPAYFNDSQRTATKNAAVIAGLECAGIINEPTAACLCYGLNNKKKELVLVFDFGGGTFDVSVIRITDGIFEVLSTAGDTHLGGEDIDHLIMAYAHDEFVKRHASPDQCVVTNKNRKKLKEACERAKKTLSTSLQTDIEVDNYYESTDLHVKLTRSKFNTICHDLFQRTMVPVTQALSDAHITKSDIHEIVLVGGSTRIPKIQELLTEYFNGATLNKSVNPDEAVGCGAAIHGAILSKSDTSGKTDEILLLDVTPLSLGIESKGKIMSVIIDRNSQLPIKKTKMYSTVEDRQESVTIKIFEGERRFTTDNHLIGDFVLCGLPKLARGVPKIEVTFNIDVNGILHVKAVDRDTAQSNEINITNTTRLSDEEIATMISDADKFRADDELKKEALSARNAFEKELAYTQKTINDTTLTIGEDSKVIVSEDEKIWLNQCILVNYTWLEQDQSLSKEKIEEAQRLFSQTANTVMHKIYARKAQLNASDKGLDKDLTNDQVQSIISNAF